MNRILFLLVLLCLPFASISAAEKPPVKIGLTVALNGKFAEFGKELLRGVQMWVDDINKRGALHGRKVKLIYYDDRSDKAACARYYEKLIQQDKVDLLLGPYSSDLTLVASEVAEKHAFPMLATGAASQKIWLRGLKNIFGIYTPANHNMDYVLGLVKKGGRLKRIALAYSDTAFTLGVAQGVRERVAEYGLDLVFDEKYPAGSVRFEGLVKRMKDTQPDLVIVSSYLDDSIAFMRQAKASRLEPKFIMFSGGASLVKFGERLKKDAQAVLTTVQWIRSQSMPGAFDFSFRFKERYKRNASYHAATGYAAGQVIEAATRLAGSFDKDAIREQLGSMKFRSLLGHYRVDATGKQIGKPMYVMQWQDGRRRLIAPKEFARFEIIPFPSWSER